MELVLYIFAELRYIADKQLHNNDLEESLGLVSENSAASEDDDAKQ